MKKTIILTIITLALFPIVFLSSLSIANPIARSRGFFKLWLGELTNYTPVIDISTPEYIHLISSFFISLLLGLSLYFTFKKRSKFIEFFAPDFKRIKIMSVLTIIIILPLLSFLNSNSILPIVQSTCLPDYYGGANLGCAMKSRIIYFRMFIALFLAFYISFFLTGVKVFKKTF